MGYLIRERHPSELRSASLHRVPHSKGDCTMLVFDPADPIQHQHVLGRFYEQEILNLILRNYREGIFLDVGANVGNHIVYIAKMLPDRKIIGFEPHPEAFAILSANISMNHLNEQVNIFNMGLSDRCDEMMLSTPLHGLGQSTLESKIRGINLPKYFERCMTVVGDDIIKDHIGFIKIDVEGHEIHVLQGLQKTIKKCFPVIFVEVDNITDNLVSEFLSKLGYQEIYRDKNTGLVRQILYHPLDANQ